MSNTQRVCPVEGAGGLDNRFRRWLHNPENILKPYLHEGMTVLDVGCGPGTFTIDMARMVGSTGRVIAADLQEGMLQKLRKKILNSELERRITLHQCGESKIGVTEKVDFVLVFYMLHEVPSQENFFREIASILKPQGRILLVEPPLHVSKAAFEKSVKTARDTGFIPVGKPKVLMSKTVLLKQG